MSVPNAKGSPRQAGGADRRADSGFMQFLWANKQWWLYPILVVTALVVVLAVLAGTGGGPFVYALF
jgi:hypothetical protein